MPLRIKEYFLALLDPVLQLSGRMRPSALLTSSDEALRQFDLTFRRELALRSIFGVQQDWLDRRMINPDEQGLARIYKASIIAPRGQSAEAIVEVSEALANAKSVQVKARATGELVILRLLAAISERSRGNDRHAFEHAGQVRKLSQDGLHQYKANDWFNEISFIFHIALGVLQYVFEEENGSTRFHLEEGLRVFQNTTSAFSKSLADPPSLAHLVLGDLWAMDGNFPAAEVHYEAAIQASYGSRRAEAEYRLAGVILDSGGDPNRAERVAKRAFEEVRHLLGQNETAEVALCMLGRAKEAQGKMREAARIYKRVVSTAHNASIRTQAEEWLAVYQEALKIVHEVSSRRH